MQKTETGNTLKKRINEIWPKVGNAGSIYVSVDEMFGCAIVHAYCTFQDLCRVFKALYGSDLSDPPARGYCFHGNISGELAHAELVWVNSDACRRNDAIPTFAHEISHMADNIVDENQVQDENGEVRASIVEREIRRVMLDLFEIECSKPVDERKVQDMVQRGLLDVSTKTTGGKNEDD